jgi:hypothetical protein
MLKEVLRNTTEIISHIWSWTRFERVTSSTKYRKAITSTDVRFSTMWTTRPLCFMTMLVNCRRSVFTTPLRGKEFRKRIVRSRCGNAVLHWSIPCKSEAIITHSDAEYTYISYNLHILYYILLLHAHCHKKKDRFYKHVSLDLTTICPPPPPPKTLFFLFLSTSPLIKIKHYLDLKQDNTNFVHWRKYEKRNSFYFCAEKYNHGRRNN